MANAMIHDIFSGTPNLTTTERAVSVVLGLGIAAAARPAPAEQVAQPRRPGVGAGPRDPGRHGPLRRQGRDGSGLSASGPVPRHRATRNMTRERRRAPPAGGALLVFGPWRRRRGVRAWWSSGGPG